MTSIAFIVLVGSLVLGLLLVCAGRRGYRINTHPTCRQCSFDLHGVYPGAVTCPECGAGIKQERFVRIGVRRRLPVLTGVGAILMILPIMPFGVALYAAMTGVNINQYKPMGLLLWEVKRATPTHAATILNELERRHAAGELSAEQVPPVIDAILDAQARPQVPWNEAWGDIIEMTKLVPVAAAPSGTGSTQGVKGGPSKEQIERFRTNGGVLELLVRPKVRAGESLPIFIDLKESRVGTSTTIMSNLSLVETTIGGKVAKKAREKRKGFLNRMFGEPSISQDTPRMMYICGSKSQYGMFGSSMNASWRVDVPDDVTPGRHEFSVTVAVLGNDMNMNSPGAMIMPALGAPKGTARTLRAVVDVVPKDQPTITSIEATTELTEKLRKELMPVGEVVHAQDTSGTGMWGVGDKQMWVTAQFNVGSLSAPVCHEVFAVIDGKEHRLGMLSSGRRSTSNQETWMFEGTGSNASRSVSVYVPKFDLKKVKTLTLIFRPRLDEAETSLDMTSVYAGEITIEGVKIESRDNWYGQQTGQSADETEKEAETATDGDADPKKEGN
jgi:hypothetical protein